jgi:hypothetical protein
MSETQNQYETEQETDAEPTPSLVESWDHRPMPKQANPNYRELVYAESKGTIAILDCVTVEDADLIAAAGTAAQEAREMGYDPQKAVEALPDLLAVLQDIDGMIEQLKYGTIRMMVNDALASAEGSDE